MSLYLVACDTMSKEQETAFLEYIKSNRFGWWHWLDNFWIISSSKKTLRSSMIRDAIDDAVPGLNNLVIKIENVKSWAGHGPSVEDNDMFEWLSNTIKKN